MHSYLCFSVSKTSQVVELDFLMIEITLTALKRKYVIYQNKMTKSENYTNVEVQKRPDKMF